MPENVLVAMEMMQNCDFKEHSVMESQANSTETFHLCIWEDKSVMSADI